MKIEKTIPKKYPSEPEVVEQRMHEAERLAHQRFGVEGFWERYDFNAMLRPSIPSAMATFVESLPFFFIATANRGGECDCSFRGREFDASGKPYALLNVLDAYTLIFPDYSGNNFFNSLGNILVNGQIGMLFIDFESRLRVRINGRAHIIEEQQAFASLWPLAQRYIRVDVTQAFGNCQARIPRMKMLEPSDSFFQDE